MLQVLHIQVFGAFAIRTDCVLIDQGDFAFRRCRLLPWLLLIGIASGRLPRRSDLSAARVLMGEIPAVEPGDQRIRGLYGRVLYDWRKDELSIAQTRRNTYQMTSVLGVKDQHGHPAVAEHTQLVGLLDQSVATSSECHLNFCE